MAKIREDIQQILSKSKKKVSPEEQERLSKLVEEIETNETGKSLKDILGFSAVDIEALYSYGYKFFQSGKFQDALPLFLFLRQLDPVSYRYTFGVAACYQNLKEYSKAAGNYLLCTYLDSDNPVPYLHMYHCYLSQNDIASACNALKETILFASDQPEYAEVKTKARLELKKLKEELKNSNKANKNQTELLNEVEESVLDE